ncbi:MAG: hypothetical protein DWQ37_21400 [Planctomycetota bacterium]|nr:MAG: hypothetical protein DWQ37_21400 [Planctomycetota bacterium]
MLSDRVRAELAQLAVSRVPQRAEPRRVPPPARPDADALEREPHARRYGNHHGEHLRFCRPLAELLPGVERHVAGALARRGGAPARLHAELASAARHFPEATLFMDLETCGFAGSPVFLVGLVRCSGGSLVIDQLLARHYAEERALLTTFWQLAAGCRTLVTFNGKSFDWPMVLDRSRRHLLHRTDGIRFPRTAAAKANRPLPGGDTWVHCDLLHHARRQWKGLLPDCKLQTLEQYVCRRRRRGDLGGAHVPAAYHDFVRTGAPAAMRSILLHNALDLATLVQLTCVLLAC